jgi:hypothetical protein
MQATKNVTPKQPAPQFIYLGQIVLRLIEIVGILNERIGQQ